MAHSWVQMFENELEAFKAYVKIYPKILFLIDTYDCLNSGLKNAIKVLKNLVFKRRRENRFWKFT